jgi:[amino group carrier protein]-lysine/ornithine hydrolase
VRRDESIGLLRDMVQIPSPSGAEADLARHLEGVLRGLGFDSRVDEVGNVVARRGRAEAPMILLLGHLDTAAAAVPPRLDGPVLHGRGTVDAKGPLAAMICAAAQVFCPDVQLVVAGVVEEETPGSRGAVHLRDTLSPGLVVVGEPSGWDGVCVGYKGRLGLRYEVRRPPCHPADPAEKATEVAVRFWERLLAHLEEGGGGGRLFDRPTATLDGFEGVIGRARLELSCRVPPGFDVAGLERWLEAGLRGGTMTVVERTPPILVDRASPVVRCLCAGIRAGGGRPRLKVKSGTTDMNVVSTRWSVPMAAYGPGDSRLDHTEDERIHLDEYLASIAVLADALERMAGDERLLGAGAARGAGGHAAAGYTEEEEREVNARLAGLGYIE